jgi:hypothetical protein
VDASSKAAHGKDRHNMGRHTRMEAFISFLSNARRHTIKKKLYGNLPFFREKPPTKIKMIQRNQCDVYKKMNNNRVVCLFCINDEIPTVTPSNITRQISEFL